MLALLTQSGIEHVREPDACFLQLLADDRGVCRDVGTVDRHFPDGCSQDAPWRVQYFVCTCSAMAIA